MSASRPAPVPAIMPSIAASIQAKSQARPELLPTSADTVVAFGKPVPARVMLGAAAARYSRGLAPAVDPEHHAERYTPELIAEGVTV